MTVTITCWHLSSLDLTLSERKRLRSRFRLLPSPGLENLNMRIPCFAVTTPECTHLLGPSYRLFSLFLASLRKAYPWRRSQHSAISSALTAGSPTASSTGIIYCLEVLQSRNLCSVECNALRNLGRVENDRVQRDENIGSPLS